MSLGPLLLTTTTKEFVMEKYEWIWYVAGAIAVATLFPSWLGGIKLLIWGAM